MSRSAGSRQSAPAGNRLVFNHISRYQPSSLDPSWKQIDLAGGGLQSANIRLARLLKRRRIAYALLLLFPVGAHRLYLEDRRGALLYCLGSAAAILSLSADAAPVAYAVGVALLARALLDVRWIDNALTRINKRLRIEVYMSQTAGAPADYQGRFAFNPAGNDSSNEERVPSFSEQERQLRDAVARQRDSQR